MKVIELTMKDNGAAISADASTVIIVRLDGNPTTGYRWQLSSGKEEVKSVQEDIEPVDSNRPGAAATFVFRISGFPKGRVILSFEYCRPWEHAVSLSDFTITVDLPDNQ